MKVFVSVLVAVAIVAWVIFAMFLLGTFPPPTLLANLSLPKSAADFGQAMGAVDGILSSIALVLGLLAVLIQVRQTADANLIGALSARSEFLRAKCDELESNIQKLKLKGDYNEKLFNNMVNKKKELGDEAKEIDAKLQLLLKRI